MLKSFAHTDIGKMRSVNQDSVFSSTEAVGYLPNLFIVADGMGGHNGGEIASKSAISHFCEYIKSRSEAEDVLDLLTSAALAANKGVLSQAAGNPELSGMGTTLIACTIDQGKCNIVHIGDSRAYKINGDSITQLTHDHSYVNEMVKAGQITHDEAREHPKRNVLTRVLGISDEMSADGYVIEMELDSTILLCSDGLYNMVPESEIKNLSKNNTSDNPAVALVAAANDGGGKDNISVIIVRYEND